MINKEIIKKLIKNDFFNTDIEIFDKINSTNTYLKENCDKKNGHIAIAKEQTSGRGRNGKQFLSSNNKGVYFSFLLKLNLKDIDIQKITILTAVAITRAIYEVYNIDVSIKWVNDIFYNNKKLGGILVETATSKKSNVKNIIVGIGINIEEVDNKIKDIATSIFEINNCSNGKNELISSILNNFYDIYVESILNENSSYILNEYKEKLFFLNKKIKIIGKQEYIATAINITNTGALVVIDEYGKEKILQSGEISIKI